ncbi:GNAT family N-acetyltransferase [Lachnobacterium bovis]|jgi:phosphinothricin acetyltransferase|uniref:Phosphinothricin acetyltransferase n=1 Tax=Lachnobacterium bovis DSM 14045 TaxID=1122142 RepID=A0A1H3KCJ3_9FIRM|nr:GNAT family N-acetyltransferase [Lachnobacterium bovis]MBQ1802014.1 N-acetyltransferase [Lachnobacterium sp.]SDY49851.1 phosphinothricin acetyltransferase [Lachnobacterium bovis DSM 14045]
MIRRAKHEDLECLMNIYNDAIINTVATFDTEEKDFDDRKKWFEEHLNDPYAIFVEEIDGVVAGYVSLSRYRDRKAFDGSVEISIYLHKDYRGQGVGTRLMQFILDFAKKNKKINTVVSLITGENIISCKLHEKFDFVYCGELKKVGFKFGKWLDLKIYQIIYERDEMNG